MADIDSALQILSRNNYKLTKQRKELLKYLYQFQSEYINVSQVDEFMHQLYPKMIKIALILDLQHTLPRLHLNDP